jgi:hypothetical protein
MKGALLVRGTNIEDVDRNELLDVSQPREPEKGFDVDQAMRTLRSQVALLRKYFPNADLTNLLKGLDDTEEDLKMHQRYVEESKPVTESPSVKAAKALIRQVTLEDMHTALMEVRKALPRLAIEHCMEILKREQPQLVQAAQRMEEGE